MAITYQNFVLFAYLGKIIFIQKIDIFQLQTTTIAAESNLTTTTTASPTTTTKNSENEDGLEVSKRKIIILSLTFCVLIETRKKGSSLEMYWELSLC